MCYLNFDLLGVSTVTVTRTKIQTYYSKAEKYFVSEKKMGVESEAQKYCKFFINDFV